MLLPRRCQRTEGCTICMACWLPGRPGHRTGCQTASVDTLLLCIPALNCPLVCQPTREGAAARSRLLQLLGSSGQASESGYGPACGVAPSLDVCAGRPAHLEGADGDAAAALGQCARAAMLPVACRQALKQDASDRSPAEAFSPIRERQIGTWSHNGLSFQSCDNRPRACCALRSVGRCGR